MDNQYIGKLLDNRYEILDVIGVGGMAMVYKAYCHRLHRFVAVKILRSDFRSDSDFRRRFHDEAQAVAMVSHPNIVSVYDISKNDELDYIVMELIDGITLKQYMKKKGSPLGWREALHYITQIMRALGHAHGRGIIHRDIKPQNIMVLRDGSVRVADFGIARVMSAAQNTLTQEALGSVHYISPEQARGSNIDERADIYSAGVVLYEMLTGRLPFEGDSPVSVAIQHISSIPLSPRDLNPEIPEALEVITLKAMAAKVERRYRNAEEMIRDLEEFRKNPNVNFDYEHQQDLIMQAVEEPTQVLDTSGSAGKIRPATRQSAVPVPPPKKKESDYEYEIYDDYREGTGRQALTRKSRKQTMIPIIAVVALFLVGVGIFLWTFLLSDLFSVTESVTIPSFLDRTVEDLQRDTTLAETFTFVEGATKPSDEYEAGRIMEQEPKANSSTKQSEEKIVVTLTISSGKELVTVPDLTNKPHQEALAIIQSLNLEADTSTYENSEITKEYVVSQIPFAEERVAPGTKVKLTLSLGPEIKPVAMPSLTNQTEAQAKKMLEELNLVCQVKYYENEKAEGMVFYQSVPAAQMMDEGSTITIHVSTGPADEPDPVPDPNQSQVPNLGGTQTIDIPLPENQETVMVKITVDGVVQYEATVNTANSPLSREIDGVGRQKVVVYFDGEPKLEFDMDFGS